MQAIARFVAPLIGLALVVLIGACGKEPQPGQVIVVNGVEMVYIPGGTFTMGDPSIGTVQVTLKPFLIDKHEVTNGEFRRFAETFHLPFPVPRAYDDLPVVNVSWGTADAFAAWRGCRLPTEAEWEFAARGSDGRRFPWGNTWDARRVNGDDDTGEPGKPDGSMDGFVRLAPAGLFPSGASPFGVEDMAGNVWEWVADWYAPYPDTPVVNYRGPARGTRKVIRGGSFRTNYLNLRTFHRAHLPPLARQDDVGFRCAADYPPRARGEVLYVPSSSDTLRRGIEEE